MGYRLPHQFAAFALLIQLSCAVGLAQTVVEPQAPPPAGMQKAGALSGNNSGIQTGTTAIDLVNDRSRIRIGPGDLLDVSLYGVADFRQEVRVNELGAVSLPLIGDCKVGGSTLEEAQSEIAKSLVAGGYFRDPHVTVVIKEYASQGVSILGEVTKPGVYPIVGPKRLFDLISQAGGFTPKAGKLITISHRDQPTAPEKVTLSDDPAKSPESNVDIYPGDTIAVSKAGIIYVVGDVQRPGGFVMENNQRMTVLEAVALAQGTNRTAALGAARILRRSPTGTSEIKIPLKQIMAAKANDLDLNPEDILFIPGSAAKNALSRGLEGVFQIATSAAIYTVH